MLFMCSTRVKGSEDQEIGTGSDLEHGLGPAGAVPPPRHGLCSAYPALKSSRRGLHCAPRSMAWCNERERSLRAMIGTTGHMEPR